MRKTNIIWGIAITLAMLTGLALNQASVVSAQGDSPVGVVIAYVPGVSITIVDNNGNQVEYALDSSLKIEPAEKADSLKIGSFVTIIAPASLDKAKQKAVGVVVHPDMPAGFKIPDWVATALIKNTPMPTLDLPTATPKASETPTPFETATDATATSTPVETLTNTPTPVTAVKNTEKTPETKNFFEWLRSLFQQALSQQ